MKLIFVFVCLALCATVALGGYQGQCRNYDKCKAKASVSIKIRGPGKCNARAAAYCHAASYRTKNCYDYKRKYSGVDCKRKRHSYIAADAKCFAGAAVEAYTKAAAEVNCHGRRVYGCANAHAGARAVACSIARSVVDIAVFHKKYKEPVCEAAIDVLIKAIADVATYSSAGGCVKGNSYLYDHDYDYAAAFEIVFAKAFAACYVHCDGHEAVAHVDGEGHADVKHSGAVTHGDDARAFIRRARARHG